MKNLLAEYRRRGWYPIPLSPGKKAPYHDGWETREFTDEDFGENDNVGLRLEGGIVDVDLDCVEALAVAGAFLPPTAIFGRESTPQSHWIYNCPELRSPVVFKDADKKVLLELRTGQSHETMVEPSVHPSDEVVTWEGKFTAATHVADITSATLQRRAALVAASALVARHYAIEGARHDWTLDLAGCFKQLGVLQEEAVEIVRAASIFASEKKWPDRKLEIDSTFRKDEDEPTTGFVKLRENDKKLADGLKGVLGGKLKKSGFIQNNNGGIIATLPENIRRAFLKQGITVSWNSFEDKKYIEQEGKIAAIDDTMLIGMRIGICDKFGFLPAKELFNDMVHIEATQLPFHPVRDYLDDLKWDGVPRLDKWLVTYGNAEDTEYVQEVGKLPLIAAVKRVYNPGEKFDELLVLESPQGWGKSTAIQTLCPDPTWFSEDLPIGSDSKVVIERTHGVWICEIAELFGMGKREADQVKSFLSRSKDGPVRLAYGREATEVKRQWIAIGSTNKGTYLRDTTGNRRFWPVTVGHWDLEGLRRDRDQLWAECVVRKQESVRMKQELWTTAAEQQMSREEVDPWEAEVREALNLNDDFKIRGTNKLPLFDDDGLPMGFKCNDRMLFEILQIDIERRDISGQSRLSSIMQRLGFKRVTSVRDPVTKLVGKGWKKEGKLK